MGSMPTDLREVYRDYIACLNNKDWTRLGQFVHDDVIHNGQQLGLSGYLAMLERDFQEIPDLYFNTQIILADPTYVASRIRFDCTPNGTFLGLPINGRKVCFHENVIYEFRDARITQVWSVIDKAAIEAALSTDPVLNEAAPSGSGIEPLTSDVADYDV